MVRSTDISADPDPRSRTGIVADDAGHNDDTRARVGNLSFAAMLKAPPPQGELFSSLAATILPSRRFLNPPV